MTEEKQQKYARDKCWKAMDGVKWLKAMMSVAVPCGCI
jgi:hypothetical protein